MCIRDRILSAREFKDGTMELLDRLEPGSALGATLGPVKAVIYRQDRTADARLIATGIREDFIRLKGRVSAVSYQHLRAHETVLDIVCRLLLYKKKHKPTPASHTT